MVRHVFLGLLVIVLPALCFAGSRAARHYRVVTIPDGDDIVQNPPGSSPAFSGPLVEFMDFLATLGNFTYELTAHTDDNFGKKQASGKWDGMVGALLDGTFDVILDAVVMTPERAEVLDGSGLLTNASAYALINPKKVSSSPNYIIKHDLWHFLLRNSNDSHARQVWQNIQAHLPRSVVKSSAEAVTRVKAGDGVFLSDKATITRFALESGGVLARHEKAIPTGMTVFSYASKKGSDVGEVLKAALPNLDEISAAM